MDSRVSQNEIQKHYQEKGLGDANLHSNVLILNQNYKYEKKSAKEIAGTLLCELKNKIQRKVNHNSASSKIEIGM